MGIWDGKVIDFLYTNYRGVSEVRRAVPTGLKFQRSEYYQDDGEQWFVVAWDLERQAERHFMLSRMQAVEKDSDQSLPWRNT